MTLAEQFAAFLASQEAAPAAVSAPRIGRAAAPFAAASVAAGDVGTVADAKRLYAGDQEQQKAYVALSQEAGLTCTVDTVRTVGDQEVPSAWHGFLTVRESGVPCPGLAGLKRGEACPGTIR